MPGREIVQWFEATKTGKYELPCAELCGFGHSGMRGWIYVHTPDGVREVGGGEPDRGRAGGPGRRGEEGRGEAGRARRRQDGGKAKR